MPRAINRRAWQEQEIVWLRGWAKRGKTAAEIAAKMGRTADSVRCKAQKEGIPLRPAGNPPTYDDRAVRAALRRIVAGETQRKIAAEMGIAPSTVSRWLNVRGAGLRVRDVIGG